MKYHIPSDVLCWCAFCHNNTLHEKLVLALHVRRCLLLHLHCHYGFGKSVKRFQNDNNLRETHVNELAGKTMKVGVTNDIAGGPWWHNAAVWSDTVLLRARRLNLTHKIHLYHALLLNVMLNRWLLWPTKRTSQVKKWQSEWQVYLKANVVICSIR